MKSTTSRSRRLAAAATVAASAACILPLLPSAHAAPPTPAAPAAYAELLAKYVTRKGVRYAAWHASPGDLKRLDEVVEFYATTTPPSAEADSLAWHVNAYNAWILHNILAKYPTKGPLDGEALFFHGNRITIAGRKTSFDHLEQKVIRPTFKEPRVHFALNCASTSCPPLDRKPFTGATLDADLDRLARAFINDNPNGIQVADGGRTLRLSKIFDWYAADFGGEDKVVAFANRFRSEKLPASARVEFMEYNWSLNEAK